MTRTQVQAADVDAEMVLADGWKTAAAAMVSNADTYVRLVTFPGGQQWSGLARDAMVAMVGSDRTAIVQARTAIDAMADKARLALDTTVRTALKAVVDEINDATGATWGFTVDDALGVSDPSALATFMLADIQRQDALERFQESIPRLAQAWWDASQAVADQISTDQAAVATVFAAQGPEPSSAHDAANTDRLATLDSLPTGLTQEAIRTVVLDSLKRNAAAKDVGKFGDSHVDEALNTIPFEQLVKMTSGTDQSWLTTLAGTHREFAGLREVLKTAERARYTARQPPEKMIDEAVNDRIGALPVSEVGRWAQGTATVAEGDLLGLTREQLNQRLDQLVAAGPTAHVAADYQPDKDFLTNVADGAFGSLKDKALLVANLTNLDEWDALGLVGQPDPGQIGKDAWAQFTTNPIEHVQKSWHEFQDNPGKWLGEAATDVAVGAGVGKVAWSLTPDLIRAPIIDLNTRVTDFTLDATHRIIDAGLDRLTPSALTNPFTSPSPDTPDIAPGTGTGPGIPDAPAPAPSPNAQTAPSSPSGPVSAPDAPPATLLTGTPEAPSAPSTPHSDTPTARPTAPPSTATPPTPATTPTPAVPHPLDPFDPPDPLDPPGGSGPSGPLNPPGGYDPPMPPHTDTPPAPTPDAAPANVATPDPAHHLGHDGTTTPPRPEPAHTDGPAQNSQSQTHNDIATYPPHLATSPLDTTTTHGDTDQTADTNNTALNTDTPSGPVPVTPLATGHGPAAPAATAGPSAATLSAALPAAPVVASAALRAAPTPDSAGLGPNLTGPATSNVSKAGAISSTTGSAHPGTGFADLLATATTGGSHGGGNGGGSGSNAADPGGPDRFPHKPGTGDGNNVPTQEGAHTATHDPGAEALVSQAHHGRDGSGDIDSASGRAGTGSDQPPHSNWSSPEGQEAARLLPTDDSGYQVQPRDAAFLRITPEDVVNWYTRAAPLGMSPTQFAEFRSSLFDALGHYGLTSDDVDIRLQGSSANFFSGAHKELPHREDLGDSFPGRRMDDWLGDDAQRPLRRPFDSMHRLGILDENGDVEALSDYDIQISSDAMVEVVQRTYGEGNYDGPLVKDKYGFYNKEAVARAFPELYAWKEYWENALGREVAPALFTSHGPPDTSAAGVSSHFRDTDWVLDSGE